MKVVYFDCPSGAAGDMIMAALIDAGAPVDRLRAELARLRLPGWELRVREVMKGPFRATKVDVDIDRSAHQVHRSLSDILAILEASSLPADITRDAARIFTRLADAEARAHGTTREAVHFHDVGAVDAIVDVVGGVIALSLLGVERVHCSALPIGGGVVNGPHGTIPMPGPGTAELLRGFPVVDTGVRAELVTPTGAAILTTLAQGAGRMPDMTVASVGYGAGTMELPTIPNLLRCFVGEVSQHAGDETVVQLETTIDDMSPQLYEPLMERLFEAGALDVFLTPVIMKRSRPGIVLTALCAPGRVGDLSRLLFEESSTIGVRWAERRRARLDRQMRTVQTIYGAVACKVSSFEGRVVTVTPEFADVARIAREKSLPVREVLDQARAEARREVLGDDRG
ncbi:MAG TPA: nickel pincer cofactor biosynthesis protein LarC [Candidatus Acidoferrum sp.]|nr:nickel pincer cofactor biosynthesis protein LarC [Candidatus Acidoferrum sp.]